MVTDANNTYIITIAADPQCIFDFQSTGNKDVALDTAKVNRKADMDSEILGKVSYQIKSVRFRNNCITRLIMGFFFIHLTYLMDR